MACIAGLGGMLAAIVRKTLEEYLKGEMAERALFEKSTVEQADKLIPTLQSTDWDFHDSGIDSDGHNIHPFPAKFIAQIPRTILSIFGVAPGTAVLDPFCGSGTTLLEAKNAGYDFVGVDLNPIAVLISRVKTNGPQLGALNRLRSITSTARERHDRGEYVVPEIPRLSHWFKPEIAAAMAALTDAIRDADCTEEVRDYLRLTLSAITVRVSNQESETRYAALDKPIEASDVFKTFEKTGENIAVKLQKSHSNLFSSKGATGRIFNSDAREIGSLEMPAISLVVTSPPYPNVFEYWLYNKYRMYWLDHDPVSVRAAEIGARPHYVSSKGDTIHDFSEQMATVFEGVSKHLRPGAAVAIVVSSDCRIRGEVFDVPSSLEKALVAIGYEPLTHVCRTIPRTRKAFNPEIGSIESETIIFMRWQGARCR